jgi:hypothetical protein
MSPSVLSDPTWANKVEALPTTMNCRQAAMLALAGWYLMLPPVHGGAQPDTQAPISQWKVFRKFDSETACREWKLKLERERARVESTARVPISCASRATTRR